MMQNTIDPQLNFDGHFDPTEIHLKQMQDLATSLMENDHKKVSKLISTASKLMKNGKEEIKPWTRDEGYIKNLLSRYKYNKVSIINSRTKGSMMMFFISYEMEDLSFDEKFEGKEVVWFEFLGSSSEIISIDRIVGQDKHRELFPEIDYEFEVKHELIVEFPAYMIVQ